MKRPGPCSMIPVAVVIAAVLSAAVPLHAETIVLDASKDNTLYQVLAASLARSNGAGPQLFAGNTGTGSIRRALLGFEVDGNIPEGATIDNVRLELSLSKFPPGSASQLFGLHRINADWGQGASNAGGENAGSGTLPGVGDATWFHTFFNTDTWTNPGGDFEPTPSASQTVANVNTPAIWTSNEMIDDVQDWLDHGSNFGWLLRGNEASPLTAKQFHSSEALDAADRPKLIVEFSLDVLGSDLTGNGFVDFEDLTILLANWNKDVGADAGNLVNAGTTPVNFEDLTVLLADWTGPGPAGSPEAALGDAVPEPSTLMLGMIATLGLSFYRRRRRRAL